MKKSLKFLLGLLAGIVIFLLWLAFVDINEIKNNLFGINISWACLGIALYVCGFFIRSYRWNIILKPVSDLKIKTTFWLFMAGNFINALVPIRAGELAKSFFLKKIKKVPISSSLPSIFVDKIMDLTPILLLLIAIPFLTITLSPILWIIILLIWIILAIALLILFFSIKRESSAVKLLRNLFFWIPKKFKNKVFNFIDLFVKGFRVLKQKPSKFILVFFITLLAVLVDTLYITSIFMAFGYKIPIIIAFFGYTLFFLSYILPTPPGQIGSMEALFALIFTGIFAIDKNLVGSVVIFTHIFNTLVIYIIGVISFNVLGLSYKVFKRAQKQEKDLTKK